MESRLNQQRLSLVRSLVEYADPAAAAAGTATKQGDFWNVIKSATLAEAVGWLHLGCELHFFEPDSASWWPRYRQIVERGLHTFPTEYSSMFHARFVPWLNAAVASSSNLPPLDVFEDSELTKIYYQDALDSVIRLNHSPLAIRFMGFVDHAKNDTFGSLMKEPVNEYRGLALLQDSSALDVYEPVVSIDELYAGFLQAVDYMASANLRLRGLGDETLMSAGARGSLRQRIAMLQGWRLNLREEQNKARFVKIAERVALLLESVAEHEVQSAAQFLEGIDSLTSDWNNFHPRFLVGGMGTG